MADLPNFADRMTDVEITANAPLTETLMRKYGSNINFILDFIGVSDGATSPSGDLSDLINAITIASAHTMTLQYTSTGAGGASTESIGTITKQKYLNVHVFAAATDLSTAYGPAASGSRWFITKRADGTGPRTLPAFGDHTLFKYPHVQDDGSTGGGPVGGTDGNIGSVATDLRFPGSGTATTDEWKHIAELDWREADSWLLEAHFANVPQVTKFYIAYSLNVVSAGLTY